MSQVVIVGGGVVGWSTAYFCAQAGDDVTIVERNSETHWGCSSGNGGMIVPSHFVPLAAPGIVSQGLRMLLRPQSPFSIRPRFDFNFLRWFIKFLVSASEENVTQAGPILRDLNLRSREIYLQWHREWNQEFDLNLAGLLAISNSESGFTHERAVAAKGRALGIESVDIESAQLSKVEPGIEIAAAGAVHFLQDAWLDPRMFLECLQSRSKRAGVKVLYETTVRGFQELGDHVTAIDTNDGTLRGDHFVFSMGSFGTDFLRDRGVDPFILPGKGYSFDVVHPPQMPKLCAILNEARVAVTPLGDRLRFAGTMELGATESGINRAKIRGIQRSIQQHYPAFEGFDFSPFSIWSGLRPITPDGLPHIGRADSYGNLWIAAGHAMMGQSLGPVTGECLSKLIHGEESNIDLTRLDPNRFRRT